MSKNRRSRDSVSFEERIAALWATLKKTKHGIHRLEPAAAVLDSELPKELIAMYRAFNGGALFHEEIILRSAREFRRTDLGWEIGAIEDDAIIIDNVSRVWRLREGEEPLLDGTSFEKWLSGQVAAQATLLDNDGEFYDGLFTDDGELVAAAAISKETAAMRKDRRAIGPRFRLALALAHHGDIGASRDLFEEIVADNEEFAPAWYELACISMGMKEHEAAIAEFLAAAKGSQDRSLRGFYLAQGAISAKAGGLEERSFELAAEATRAHPPLAKEQLDTARQLLHEGRISEARMISELAILLAPRDLDVLDFKKQLQQSVVAMKSKEPGL